MKKSHIIFTIIVILFLGVGIYSYLSTNQNTQKDSKVEINKEFQIVSLIEDLDHPWDVKLASDGTIFFTQRQTGLYKYIDEVQEVYLPDDLYNSGEGGMLGFDLAPDFEQSREIYACFNSQKSDTELNIIVSKLTLNNDFSGIESREDIITDIESSESGRHSGCRVIFDRNNNNILWITTGDAANADNPQDPESLNGKVLRVDKNGVGVEGNLGDPFDPRIFSYGHRNLQGITLLEEYNQTYGYGFTAEHGPDVDDEINPLIEGNFGWDPKSPYNENVPMTDLDKYPDAIQALWSSGDRTIAMSGILYIDSGLWQGDILLAALKDSYILRFQIQEDGSLEKLEEVINNYGRIRQVYQAENGRIFFTTDNGNEDIIGEIVFN
jgi:glucose/arabinose dehydrogenase